MKKIIKNLTLQELCEKIDNFFKVEIFDFELNLNFEKIIKKVYKNFFDNLTL
jgi:hypothetical protein